MQISALTRTGSGVEFQTAPGAAYRFEGTDDLTSKKWTVLIERREGPFDPFDCAQGTRAAQGTRTGETFKFLDPEAPRLPNTSTALSASRERPQEGSPRL